MKLRSLIALFTITLATASGCVLEVDADADADFEATEALAVEDEVGWESDSEAYEEYYEDGDLDVTRPDREQGEPNIAAAARLTEQSDPDPTPWRLASDPGPDPWDGS